MSIASTAISDAAISAQRGGTPAPIKTPPVNRVATAKADSLALPEPR